jgi:flagellar protein FlbD
MLNLQRNQTQRPPGKRKLTVILLTRTNGAQFYLNPDLIQTVEATPDTVLTLVSNRKLIVKETPAEIAGRFLDYRRNVSAPFMAQHPE